MKKLTENYYTVFHASAIFKVIDGVLMFFYFARLFLEHSFCKNKNTQYFNISLYNIYPPELELKAKHEGPHATSLDLQPSS